MANAVTGDIWLSQVEGEALMIWGSLSGFESNGVHGFHVHVDPVDDSFSCDSTGGHYMIDDYDVGATLGDRYADENGNTEFLIVNHDLTLFGDDSIIGRSITSHATDGSRNGCGTIASMDDKTVD